jgi:hypothetical protein
MSGALLATCLILCVIAFVPKSFWCRMRGYHESWCKPTALEGTEFYTDAAPCMWCRKICPAGKVDGSLYVTWKDRRP